MANQQERDLMQFIRANNLDEYGSVIMAEDVRSVLGIEMPEYGTKRDFDKAAMLELAGIDYCRNVLLGEGKYLAQTNGNYRILLPSENAEQVESYMRSADSKLKRGLKLHRNSAHHPKTSSNTSARILAKQESIRQGRKHAESLS